MNTREPHTSKETNDEITALIGVLHATEHRLEQLTVGEIDTVADREGRIFLLRRAQEQLRVYEAVKQAAILDALPAHIALIDGRGVIVLVNEPWRQFGIGDTIQSPGYGINCNYLEICDDAKESESSAACQIAAGIRTVLSGAEKHFSIEYPCHSSTQKQWFMMTATPLPGTPPGGAVIMRLDVTTQKLADENLRVSELRFKEMAENNRDVISLQNIDDRLFTYVSPAFETIWGRSCASLYAHPEVWTASIHPDDQATIHEIYTRLAHGEDFKLQFRILRPDGEIRWVYARGFPVKDAAGKMVRIAGITEDITDKKHIEQTLRESERRFSNMLKNVELASVMLDREGRITYCNEYLLRLSGWRREDVIGRSWFEMFMSPDVVGEMRPVYAALLANLPEAWHVDNEILTRSGERRMIRWNNSVLRSGTGDVIGTASIGEDITERKVAEARIAYLNRVYAVLSGINTLIVRVRDRNELFRSACQIAVEQGGFLAGWIGLVDPLTQKVVIAASVCADEELMAFIRERVSLNQDALSKSSPVALKIQNKNVIISNDLQSDIDVMNAEVYVKSGIRSLAVFPLLVSDESVGMLALYAGETEFFHHEEVTLLERLAGDIAFAIDNISKDEQLDYLAYYDALTGLANRTLFVKRVGEYMRTAASNKQKLAVFLIDLERFKNINDSLGQTAGDALLRQVAAWLIQSAAGDASLLARVGSDHFAVVRPVVASDDDLSLLVEERMAALLEHPFHLNGAVFRISFKAGIAVFPDDGADADTLFRNAEAALKKAKASGERCLLYAQKMTAMVAGKLTLENQLRHAFDNEEFVLHYQPKINLIDGKLTGAEALIRWNDPRTGLVPPGRFIPILEETGLIYDVGRWALRKAIEDYLRWRSGGLAVVRIAVNVSPLQLRNHGFVNEIRQVIAVDTDAAAGLELEITESLIMEDINHNVASLKAIQDMGVTIAIDDFGTGFSSLSYLAKLPVDTLKIDRSFVIDMTASPEGLALVSTIINLAHALKLNAVAEGVETEEQARLLRLLNCDEMQGYLFSKPVAADIFETRFLASNSARN